MTQDKKKTKAQLIQELEELRQLVSERPDIKSEENTSTESGRSKESALTSQQMNEMLLDSLPHPAMLIRKDKTILAANSIAREVGAICGDPCWCGFGHSEFLPDEDKQYIAEHHTPPPEGTRCTFCQADEALEDRKEINVPDLKAFGRVWDTYWIPFDDNVYLHYAVDVTERKQAEEDILRRSKESRCLAALAQSFLTGDPRDVLRILKVDIGQNLYERLGDIGVSLFPYSESSGTVFFPLTNEIEPSPSKWHEYMTCSRSDAAIPPSLERFRHIAETRKSVICDDAFIDPSLAPIIEALGHENEPVHFRSRLDVPAVRGNEVVAFIACRSMKVAAFSQADRMFFEQVASIVSVGFAEALAEEALRVSERRYRSLVNEQEEMICRWTPDRKLTFMNDAYCRFYGRDRDDLTGSSWPDLLPEGERDAITEEYREIVKNPQRRKYEYEECGVEGRKRWLSWIECPIFDDEGQLIEFQSVGREITERKRTENQVQLRMRMTECLASLARSFIMRDARDTVRVLKEEIGLGLFEDVGGVQVTFFPYDTERDGFSYPSTARISVRPPGWRKVLRTGGIAHEKHIAYMRHVLRSRESYNCSDVLADPLFVEIRELLEKQGCRSRLVVPVIGSKIMYGLLVCSNSHVGVFTRD
ncbi:PAS domain S-box protein, partial [Candidatus Hydrogenedentota bacterium]